MTQRSKSVYKLLPLGYTQQQTKSLYAGTVFYSCLKKKEGSISCCRQDYFFSQTLSKLKNTSLSACEKHENAKEKLINIL